MSDSESDDDSLQDYEELENEVTIEDAQIMYSTADVNASPDNKDPNDLWHESKQPESYNEPEKDPLALLCTVCNKNFSSNETLSKHQFREHKSSIDVCRFCRRIFYDRWERLEHESKHKTQKERALKCTVCPRFFFSKQLLSDHESTHEMNGAKFLKKRNTGPRTKHSLKVQCLICKLEFASKLAFLRHTEGNHCNALLTQLRHFCSVCSGTVEQDELDKHYCRPLFQCDYCSRNLSTKNRLITHMKCAHFKNSQFGSELTTKNFCLRCNLHFNSTEDFVKHNLETEHNILNFFSCETCKKVFTNEFNLSRHQRRHETYFANCKYTCRYCKSKFGAPKKLLGHYASKHPKEKPYKCVLCELEFQTKRRFALHIKVSHKGIGKMKFMTDFSIVFTPNSMPMVEFDEPTEVGAIETVETTSNINDVNFTDSQLPTLNLSEQPIKQTIKRAKIFPLRKQSLTVPTVKELKLNLDKNVAVSQQVVIKKISEEEARMKKRMFIKTVPLMTINSAANETTFDDCNTFDNDLPTVSSPVDNDNENNETIVTDPVFLKTSEPLQNMASKGTKVNNSQSDDSDQRDTDNDAAYSEADVKDKVKSLYAKKSLVLVNLSPLQTLMGEVAKAKSENAGTLSDGDLSTEQSQPDKSELYRQIKTPDTTKPLVLVNPNMLQNLLRQVKKKREPKSRVKKLQDSPDYLSIIKESLKETVMKPDEAPKPKRIPKPRYQHKQYDYLSIIRKSLLLNECVSEKVTKGKGKKVEKMEQPKLKEKQVEQKDYLSIIRRSLKLNEEVTKTSTARKRRRGKAKANKRGKAKAKRTTLKLEF